MKERFRKKIAPIIHTFNLTDQELDRFRKCQRGIEVELTSSDDDDTCDSEAETEVPEEHARSSTVLSEKTASQQNGDSSKTASAVTAEQSIKRAQSTPKKGDKEIVDTELEVTAINVPRSSPRLAQKTVLQNSPDLLEEVPKKRHKLWTQVSQKLNLG